MSGCDHVVTVVVKSFNFIFRENALRILKLAVSLLGLEVNTELIPTNSKYLSH